MPSADTIHLQEPCAIHAHFRRKRWCSYFCAMRFWVLLLALYVLVLSGVPCDALCQDEPATAATTQQGPGAPAEQKDCKNCSPLSACAAATGFILPAAVPAWRAAPSLPAPHPVRATLYRTPHTLDVAARIWQPPRLA